ncbi:MAG: hypothetical protein RL329_1001 [Bacteroidota bacterium]
MWVMDVQITRIFTRFLRIAIPKIRENLVKIRVIRISITLDSNKQIFKCFFKTLGIRFIHIDFPLAWNRFFV